MVWWVSKESEHVFGLLGERCVRERGVKEASTDKSASSLLTTMAKGEKLFHESQMTPKRRELSRKSVYEDCFWN